MQRPIKFRAWDKKNKSMSPPKSLDDLCIMKDTLSDLAIMDGDIEWLEYTGLKDSELTEEYFGDIIEAEDGTRWVVEDGSSAVLYETVGTKGILYWWNLPTHKVIGNIYLNKDLIK